ncbi:MAG: hypothetical protein ABI068_15885 [Ktedonobacterales bacterium]
MDHTPQPDDPICLTRAEFDQACAELLAAGVPIKADRDDAWRNFAGWRVTYERPLLTLAHLTMAPTAPWTADRAPLPLPAHALHISHAQRHIAQQAQRHNDALTTIPTRKE